MPETRLSIDEWRRMMLAMTPEARRAEIERVTAAATEKRRALEKAEAAS